MILRGYSALVWQALCRGMLGRKPDCAFGKDLPTAISQRMGSILLKDKTGDLRNSLLKLHSFLHANPF
jgi:hypothetical protein